MATSPGIIDQSINGGQSFNGAAPTTVPVDADGIRTFPLDNVGGEFSFDFAQASPDGSFETYVIDKIMVDFALAALNTVDIKDAAGRVFNLASPGVGPYLYIGPLELAWDEKIVITSGISATDMHARVHARPGRTRPAS